MKRFLDWSKGHGLFQGLGVVALLFLLAFLIPETRTPVHTRLITLGGRAATTVISFLGTPALTIGGLIGLLVVLFSVWRAAKAVSLKLQAPPDYISYTADVFHGTPFAWRWARDPGGSFSVVNLRPTCPKCGCDVLDFVCPNCGHYSLDVRPPERKDVLTLISHRIRLKAEAAKMGAESPLA